MEDFQAKWAAFWKKFGSGRKMVLSTSANNRVTSRMMSMVQKDGILYFQTDKTFLKYQQLQENHNVALCMDNIQIEGICNEIGHPLEKEEFISLYKEYFPSSFRKYSSLGNL